MARKGYSAAQRQAKRDELLDAAQQVFENDGGINAVSFRSVAAVVGCSYSAPYRYFSGKDELITALRARAYRWMQSELEAAIEPHAHARRALDAVAHAYIKAGMARPSLYALMYFELEGSDFGQRSLELKAAKRDALGVCSRAIAAGQKAGKLANTIDALTAAHMFWIGAHGLVSLQVGGQFVMGRSVDQLVPVLIQWLETGLQHHDYANLPPLTADPRQAPRTGAGVE